MILHNKRSFKFLKPLDTVLRNERVLLLARIKRPCFHMGCHPGNRAPKHKEENLFA